MKMSNIKLDSVRNQNTMNLGDLWVELNNLTSNVVNDIKLSDEYDISVRKIQLLSIKTLITEIEYHHTF